mgnify:FL=1
MTDQARIAIHAANNRRTWGRYATVRYCAKRGVPRRLLTLALQLSAVQPI